MPVKLNAKIPTESAEARIEIIPLIDIMFFLLASFMLVSLSMVNVKSLKLDLPTATTAAKDEAKKEMTDISVDKAGGIFLDKKPIDDAQLLSQLAAAQKTQPNLRILISGDRAARHGDVIHVLDIVRAAGIERVAFEINPAPHGSLP